MNRCVLFPALLVISATLLPSSSKAAKASGAIFSTTVNGNSVLGQPDGLRPEPRGIHDNGGRISPTVNIGWIVNGIELPADITYSFTWDPSKPAPVVVFRNDSGGGIG